MSKDDRTPIEARRSWYFVEGANEDALRSAPGKGLRIRAGLARVEVGGSLVEVPIYLNARRLLERAARLGIV